MRMSRLVLIALFMTSSVVSAFAGLLELVQITTQQTSAPQSLMGALQRQVGLSDQDYRSLAEILLERARQTS